MPMPNPATARRPSAAARALAAALAALVTTTLAATHATGQTVLRNPTQPTNRAAGQTATATIALAEDPIRIPSAGLTIFPPAGSTSTTTRLGEQITIRIAPETFAADGTRWFINLQTIRPPEPGHTPRSILERILQAKAESVARVDPGAEFVHSSQAGLISHDFNLTIANQPASRAYIAAPEMDGTLTAHGYTVFQNGPQRFLVIELIAPPENLATLQPMYETSVGTVRLEDPTELATRRAAAIAAGQAMRALVTESDMRAVVLNDDGSMRERWERLFAPAVTGADTDATEAGYRRIRTWIGQRGELDPRRTPDRFNTDEKAPGYLLRMDTRLLNRDPARPSGLVIVDSSAVFFMSLDREQEAWRIDMVVESPTGEKSSWNETGARTGRSMTIAVSQSGAAPQAVKPLIEGEGYVSRLEAYLLPDLMLRAGVPLDYGFYAYQPALQTITFRSDSLTERTASLWQLETKIAEDADPQVALYRSSGEHVQTILPDGRVWAPTTLDRLATLWRDKNLPMN